MVFIELNKLMMDYSQKCRAIKIIGQQNWKKAGCAGHSNGVAKTDIDTVEKFGFGFVHCTEEEWLEAMSAAR